MPTIRQLQSNCFLSSSSSSSSSSHSSSLFTSLSSSSSSSFLLLLSFIFFFIEIEPVWRLALTFWPLWRWTHAAPSILRFLLLGFSSRLFRDSPAIDFFLFFFYSLNSSIYVCWFLLILIGAGSIRVPLSGLIETRPGFCHSWRDPDGIFWDSLPAVSCNYYFLGIIFLHQSWSSVAWYRIRRGILRDSSRIHFVRHPLKFYSIMYRFSWSIAPIFSHFLRERERDFSAITSMFSILCQNRWRSSSLSFDTSSFISFFLSILK